MVGPITGETPAIGPSGELGIDARQLMNADVTLVVGGEAATPDVTLKIELFDGPVEVVPLPDRFVDGSGPTVDVGALIDWLGVETMTLPAFVPVVFDTRMDDPEDAEARWLLVRPMDADPRGEELFIGQFAGFEGKEAMMAGAVEGSAPSPEPEPGSVTPPKPMSEDESWGCLGFLARNVGLSVVVGALAVIALVGGLLYLTSGDDKPETSDSTSGGETGEAQEEEAAEETAEALLNRLTAELIESGTVSIEQTLTVSGGSGGETDVPGTGVVDYDVSDAQLSIDVSSATGQTGADGILEVYLTGSTYAFSSRALTPEGADVSWVQAAPGEIDSNEDVERLGLNAVGIGETFNPVAMTAMAAAAEDAVRQDDGSIEATVTLPVEGSAADHVDNTVRSVYGTGQEELAGLGIKLTVRPRISADDFIELTVEMALDDAIPFLGDDPEAEAFRDLVISNRTVVTDVEVESELPARDVPTEPLTDFLARYP